MWTNLLRTYFWSMEKIEVVSNAMELRGFGKKKRRTWYAHRKLAAADIPVTDLVMRQRFLGWMAQVGMNTSNLRVTGSACMSTS